MEQKLILPDKPEGLCDEVVQEKINRAFEKASKMTFNESLARNKNFQNPHVLDLLSKVFEVDMMGSNFPKDKFDPKAYPDEAFYENQRWASSNAVPVVASKTSKISVEKST
jgi:hypothetical protein